jgi:ribulose-5-phosphate 4-epimerase/fuculose-1-phosphate aldolase
MNPAEWDQRVNLAACYRLVAMYGWDGLIVTHISARVPGAEHHFLINPYGMLFDEIMASSLVKIDLNGAKVEESPYDVNPAGFTIHSAIHASREDAQCVLHVHSPNGVAVSAQGEIGIDPRILAGATAQTKQVLKGAGGALAWPALLRKLERADPSYRT